MMKQALINSETVMYGVIGDPIVHSKSPIMMNRAFSALQINAAYAAFHIKPHDLQVALAGMKAMHFGGLNVTIPHKVAVMSFVDELDESARISGAVNTIVNNDGRWIGYNTDGIGYVRSLQEETGMQLRGKRIAVLGAGGAARGIIYALALQQPEIIYILNRTVERAEQLAVTMQSFADVKAFALVEADRLLHDVDLVINTTDIGMHPHVDRAPLNTALLHESLTVSDIVYNPRMTKLLSEAEKRGCTIHGGLGMFIYQGAYAFEYWTGQPAPVAIMHETVEQSL